MVTVNPHDVDGAASSAVLGIDDQLAEHVTVETPTGNTAPGIGVHEIAPAGVLGIVGTVQLMDTGNAFSDFPRSGAGQTGSGGEMVMANEQVVASSSWSAMQLT